jgi:hypothetical protein
LLQDKALENLREDVGKVEKRFRSMKQDFNNKSAELDEIQMEKNSLLVQVEVSSKCVKLKKQKAEVITLMNLSRLYFHSSPPDLLPHLLSPSMCPFLDVIFSIHFQSETAFPESDTTHGIVEFKTKGDNWCKRPIRNRAGYGKEKV